MVTNIPSTKTEPASIATVQAKAQPKRIRPKGKVTFCMRCGACLTVCPHKLSPVLIKEAYQKGQTEKLRKLKVEFCEGCGNCTNVCPAGIDLKLIVLKAKASLDKAK